MTEAARKLNDLREEALAAARGLSSGESALADVLRDLEQERSRAAQAYHAVVRSLAAALEARDGYTGEHSGDVHDLSVAVAQRLGLDAQAVAEVEAVALLHDVGKIGVPDHVLHKPGPLTPEEWELMREHPVIGERILMPLPGLSAVARAVRHEHERWDGGGYPDGLAGDDIPLASRIVLACDAYHALVSDRPYRRAMSVEYAIGELRDGSGSQFDPAVVDALLWCVSVEGGMVRPAAGAGAGDVTQALTGAPAPAVGGRPERELHALLAIASAVSAAHRLEDVIELAAEAACEAVDAASLSVSRWEVEMVLLRTLVNVGDLAPGETRRPGAEVYRLDEQDEVRRVVEDGGVYVFSLGDPGIPEREAALLRSLGKHHVAGVPIMLGGRPWGELWATRTAGQRRFDERDVRFLRTVCGQIAAAAGRSEVFSRMAELAFQDGLTGVANRRALDERLELALSDAEASGGDVAVLLCDVDNLKELNDGRGHAAGDDALVRVATALRTAVADAGREASATVARAGGDEFCVLLVGASAEEAQAVGERVLEVLAAQEGPALTVSCGVASLGLGAQRGGDLLRAADAAQYTAKRTGRARVCVADPDMEGRWKRQRAERRAVRGQATGSVEIGPVLAYTLEALDGPLASAPVLDRLEAVTAAVAEAFDATAVGVSWRACGGELIEPWFAHDRRTGSSSGRRLGTQWEQFAVADYPASARLLDHGGELLVEADDPDADPAERRLLEEYGMAAVLAVGLPEPDPTDGAWLIELYADARTKPLALAGSALRLLGAEAVRGAPARVRTPEP